jgi:hypothetical protein
LALSSIAGVTGIRQFKLRAGGQSVWDIDVGFVYDQALFLIEAKNERKDVQYYFDGTEVSDRVTKMEARLERLDGKLKENIRRVRLHWRDCEPLSGAICLLTTTEAELVASASHKWWVSRLECPRICMLTELIDFLNTDGVAARLAMHPAFVSFRQ